MFQGLKILFLLIVFSGFLKANQYDQYSNLSLQELLKVKVTTSTLSEHSLINSPGIITVFNRDAMNLIGARTLEDVVNFIPGFTSSKTIDLGHKKNIYARGSKSQLGDNILILIDGHRMNDAISGGAMTFMLDYPLGNVKQIEFVRGTGSAIYGANAVMGIINIITYSPDEDYSIFDFKAGNNSSVYLDLAVSPKVYEDLYYQVYISYNNFDYDNLNLLDVNKFMQNGETLPFTEVYKDRISAFAIEQATYFAQLKYKNLTLQHILSGGEASNFWNLGTSENYTDDKYRNSTKPSFHYISLAYEDELSSKLDLNIRSNYRRGYTEVIAKSVAAFPEQIENKMSDEIAASNFTIYEWENFAINTDIHFDYNINKNHNLIFGASYQYDDVSEAKDKSELIQDENSIIKDTIIPAYYTGYGIPAETRNIYALFVEHDFKIFDNLSLFSGLRLDYYDSFGESLNPRIALVYQAFERLTLKSQYSRAFKSPNLKDMYRYMSRVIANPDLKPEIINNYEFQINYTPIKDFNFAITGLFYTIDDLIKSKLTNNPNIPRQVKLTNTGHQETYGVELEFRYFTEFNLSLIGNYSYYKSVERIFDNKHDIEGIPSNMINAGLLYNPDNGFQASLTMNSRLKFSKLLAIPAPTEAYPDMVFFDDLVVPDYTLFNLRLAYTGLIENMTISLDIWNIFDQDNYSTTLHSYSPAGMPGSPRQILFGIKYQFDTSPKHYSHD